MPKIFVYSREFISNETWERILKMKMRPKVREFLLLMKEAGYKPLPVKSIPGKNAWNTVLQTNGFLRANVPEFRIRQFGKGDWYDRGVQLTKILGKV